MNQEDLKNLVGWLQAIYKKAELTQGELSDVRAKVAMIPEIRDASHHSKQDSGDAERKIDDARNHLDGRIHRIEDSLNELKGVVRDIQSKVDRMQK